MERHRRNSFFETLFLVVNKKKILIISEAQLIKTFILPAVKKLIEETDTQFDCFIVAPIDDKTRISLNDVFRYVFVNEFPKGFIKTIPKIRIFQTIYGLRKLAKSLGDYDIAYINYHHYYYSYFTPIIRNKTKKFFLSFFGSDFNLVRAFGHQHNLKTVSLLDGVFTSNEILLNQIISRYKISPNIIQTGNLIQLVDNIDTFKEFLGRNTIVAAKKLWAIEKGLIVCGYSGAAIVRHEIIIDSLNRIADKLHEYKVIFPMTYSDETGEQRVKVKRKLKECSFNSTVLETYLTIEKLQFLRLAADIFIHIQSVDQMASSLLEHLAAGSVVVTGKWLPYDDLVKRGMYFVTIESPRDLSQALSNVLDNIEDHKNKSKVNREIVLNMMSWDSIKKSWYKYFELEKKYKQM